MNEEGLVVRHRLIDGGRWLEIDSIFLGIMGEGHSAL